MRRVFLLLFTPENLFVTSLIVYLCKNYKEFYDTFPENAALHEQYLGIKALALNEAIACV